MFSLSMLDVGQGEAFIIDMPGNSFVLIDGGPQRRGLVYSEVEARVGSGKQFLWAMATQWDADHVRGLIDILGDFTPRDLILPGLDLPLLKKLIAKLRPGTTEVEVVNELEGVIRDKTISTIPAWARFELPGLVSGMRGWCLSPSRSVRDEVVEAVESKTAGLGSLRELGNRSSIACWFHVYTRKWFLPGELEADQFAEAQVQFDRRFNASAGENPHADVVKLSHHGARSNNPIQMFQYFAKRGAAALVSAGGRYGHPSPVSLERLRTVSNGVPFCTNLGQGCSIIQRDGKAANLEEWEGRMRWSSVSNPSEKCHSSVRVEVYKTGKCQIVPTTLQAKCPFGASTDTVMIHQ